MAVQSPDSTRLAPGDKRERILDAAERVFAESGFFHARISEIARAAGVADGTIYLYFKSKDDLLISLFDSRMERVNRAMARAAASADTPVGKLEAMVRTHLEMVREHPDLAEILTVEGIGGRSEPLNLCEKKKRDLPGVIFDWVSRLAMMCRAR